MNAKNLTTIMTLATSEPEELPKTYHPCFATCGNTTSATSALPEPEQLRKTHRPTFAAGCNVLVIEGV